MKVVSMPRVSSLRQAKKGDSIESQTERIKEFCNTNGFEIVDTLIDSKSATIKDSKISIKLKKDKLIVEYDLKSRPSLNKILQDSSSGKFDAICFWRWDRFSRDPPFAKIVQRFLNKKGIKLMDPKNQQRAVEALESGVLNSRLKKIK